MTKSMGAQRILTPSGETMVVMPLDEYEALLDAADIAAADRVLKNIAEGRDEFIPSEMVDRMLGGENLIHVWREYRGLDVAALADKSDISADYLADVEAGNSYLSEAQLARVAAALNLTVDDLI